jgi:FkbM family methyltransferase
MENNENGFFLWEYLQSVTKPVVLFGTGDGADKILTVMERYSLKPACFTASGDFHMNKTFRDYAVLPFEAVERKYGDFIVLICFGSDKPEVLEKLYALPEKYETYAPDMPVAYGDSGESHNRLEIYTPEYIAENQAKLDKTRKLLADEKSRLVFDRWLEYRLSGKIDILDSVASPREELLSLLKLGQEEFFVDAGAFKGDTIEEFLKAVGQDKSPETPRFKKIIAIEPDAKNYTLLRRKFYAYGSGIFRSINAVAWDKDETVKFNAKTGRGGGVNATGGRQVDIAGVTVDTLVEGNKPTYIKIDVEGAERKVLQGARASITKHRPKMLVSLYHRSEDMFELPLLIHSFNPRYKLYLRKTRCLPGWEFNLIII